MKKLLLTAALGLGLGGGAWKYQNPEGTLEDFRTQASATTERIKVGMNAVRTSNPAIIKEREEQQTSEQLRQQADSEALAARLEKLEEVVLPPNDDQSPNDATIVGVQTNDTENLAQQAGDKAISSSLESTIATLQASIQTMESDSAAGLARANAIDSRLELLMRRVEEQTFALDIASVKEGLQVLGADVLDLQSTIKLQETSLASDIAGVNEQTDALDNRLDTLASLAQQGAVSEGSADELAGPALATLSAGIDERFGALEDRLQTVNSDSRRLGGLDKQLLALQTEIALLKTQMSETDSSVGEISANIDGLKTASESMSIETVQAEIRDQLASVQSQLENDRATDNSSELEALIDITRNRIRTLEQRVQELPASSEEADTALQSQSALESQITALERRLESINQADPNLANTLSDVQQQVEELASQSFVTQADLKAQSEGRTVEYKIYFDSNSATITSGAEIVLKSFIAQEKNRTTGVSIYGFTDRSGSAFYNQKLAEQRATNVRSYLIQNGIDYTAIKALTGLGEDASAAILPDNAKDSQQRVVVLYAQQP